MAYLTVVYGNDPNEGIFSGLLRLLDALDLGYIASDARGGLYRRGKDADVFIAETSCREALFSGGDILIVKRDVRALPKSSFAYVILPDEHTLFISADTAGQTVISCGINHKSSVTVSSNAGAKLCMFIQRKFTRLNGDVICQQALPILK